MSMMDQVDRYMKYLGVWESYCNTCCTDLLSYSDMLYHVCSPNHKKNLISGKGLDVTGEVSALRLNNNNAQHNNNYCFICNDVVEKDLSLLLHIKTNKHIANAYIYLIIRTVNQIMRMYPWFVKEVGLYKCIYCNLNLSGLFECFHHGVICNHEVLQVDLTCNRELKWHGIQDDFSCELCDEEFSSYGAMRAHILSPSHKEECERHLRSEGIDITSGGEFECILCSERFGLLNALGHIVSIHHGKRKLWQEEQRKLLERQEEERKLLERQEEQRKLWQRQELEEGMKLRRAYYEEARQREQDDSCCIL